MATSTANLKLTKPAVSDAADIGVLNSNFDKIDTKCNPALFAPSGYGLGEAAGKSCADCNEATENGYYQVLSSTLNRPSISMGSRCWMHVVSYGGTYKTQIAYAEKYMQMRVMVGGTWTEWEWVNPPMIIGVEYRTTERYDGHPVYIKTMDCGKGTADGAMNSYPNVGSNCVYVDMSCRALNTSSGWGFMLTDKLTFATAAAGHSTVSLNAGRDLTAQNIYLTVKYYKV